MPQSNENSLEKGFLKSIGFRIRKCIELKGWSQEKLAEEAGIHDRTIGKIERGQLNFSVTILCRLSRALSCTARKIIGDGQ